MRNAIEIRYRMDGDVLDVRLEIPDTSPQEVADAVSLLSPKVEIIELSIIQVK